MVHQEKTMEEEWSLIKTIRKYLLEFKYISSEDSKKDIIRKCRELVGVNSLVLLNKVDSFVCLKEQHSQKETNCFFQNFLLKLLEKYHIMNIEFSQRKAGGHVAQAYEWKDLCGKRCAVIGLGVSNLPLAHLLLDHGALVTVRDRKTREELAEIADRLEQRGDLGVYGLLSLRKRSSA